MRALLSYFLMIILSTFATSQHFNRTRYVLEHDIKKINFIQTNFANEKTPVTYSNGTLETNTTMKGNTKNPLVSYF